MNDLVKRLRELHQDYEDGRWRQYDTVKQILTESADHIESLDFAAHKWHEKAKEWERKNAALRAELERRKVTLARVRGDYNDLIMQVIRKHPDETRHETARRYIQEAETASDNEACKADELDTALQEQNDED